MIRHAIVVVDLKAPDQAEHLRASEDIVNPGSLSCVGCKAGGLVAWFAPYVGYASNVNPSSVHEVSACSDFADISIEVSYQHLVFAL